MLTALPIDEFTAKLPSAETTPGGGSAVALTGLIAVNTLQLGHKCIFEKPGYGGQDITAPTFRNNTFA